MPLRAGSRVGPYEILAAIGAGGMGEVWRARDSRLERDVALKVLPAAALGDDTARARLVREARLASKLNHPHICTIYEVGETEGQTHIAMELVEGQTLAARLQGGALPADDVVRYGRQLAGALAHAHGRGVVHRDFKSANVVVTPDGHVKVLDFGLARRLGGDGSADDTTMSRQTLTEAGAVAGTLAYMAPEQLRGQAADARSDIWALGVVLYELAAGRRPFHGKTGFELSSAILNQPAPAVPETVPAPLAGVIGRCLAKEPGERYQQAGEAQAALDAVSAGTSGTPPPRGTVRSRRWMLPSLAAALLIVVAAVLLAMFDVGGIRSRVIGGSTAARIVKVAVLPFANVSGDATQEYLSDGLTTEMIALLGRLHPETLRVFARTSVMQYKGTQKPIQQIASELGGVDYILEGSALREAGRIRITADLIKVADQTQLWADRYERELAGILVLQNEVAQQVAKALALKLLPAEQARLAGAKNVDPEVYDLCLKGRDHLGRYAKADFDAAEQYFERALAKDPASATAYAGVAAVWLYRRQLGFAPPRESGEKARAAALKAIALDDTLAEAHLRLAGLFTWTDFAFRDAEREYLRAIELDPNDPMARVLYAHALLIVGRRDEGMAQAERGVMIDPLDVGVRGQYVYALIYARRYDEAASQAGEILRAQPANIVALGAYYFTQHVKQRYADVIATAATYYEAMGYGDVAEALRKGYAESGYAAAWRRAMDVEVAKHGNDPGVAMDAASNYPMIGERARALDLLEKAYADRDPNIPYIGCHPVYDPLRAEPRFQALLRRMNLPQ